jgi:xanthine/uracil permease
MNWALLLYLPLLVALVVGFAFMLRTLLQSSSGRQMEKMALLAALVAGVIVATLVLMFGVTATWAPWAAVITAAVVVVPVLQPIGGLMLVVFIDWIRGKPMRWN